ncbi:aminoglycoside phosphotransferase family protein [Phenylobacterium sp.]|uniref:aminoglycoside phosphotransferase family protein n=1 Tax=Phenylobacterium sp. TaxID=1871053 RepID=UPI00286A664A|nr:aminoglycoside phosphotransferase family protein [Phenylobacterium sp.]
MKDLSIFSRWIERWSLTPDGEPFQTPYTGNWLIPVRRAGAPAILKLATSDHERAGAALMAWLDGDGAARVLALEDEALLLERLPGTRSLVAMARDGADDEVMRILCAVGDRLHAPRAAPPPASLMPLRSWFRALAPAAAIHGGVLSAALAVAEELLDDPRDVCLLHGDLHHQNVVDGGERGWLIIDPKGLLGERAYEYATTICNPDEEMALRPGRLARQAEVIAKAARLDRERLLRWTLAHAGVSAAWCMADGFDPAPALRVAELAQSLTASA